MKSGFRQSMSWLHTWGGLTLSWILYFVFLTGTLGYFDTEIDRWMKPELSPENANLQQSLITAQQRLQQQAPGAERWFISPPTNRDNPHLRIFWQTPEADGKPGGRGNELLNAATGQPLTARATGGGQTLYRMHYALHYIPANISYWIVGICAMFMLVAIISGVVIHKKIFKDIFTFRSNKGQRSWLDMHNLLSVSALPFHLMITYSGLLFFVLTYMSLIVSDTYGFGEKAHEQFEAEFFSEPHNISVGGNKKELANLSAMAAIAESHWGADQVRYVDIDHPGSQHARVKIGRQLDSPLRASPELVFDGTSGELLTNNAAITSTPKAIYDVFLGLHEGLFANTGLRWLYFFSGLLGTAMIATGMVLWSLKRRPAQLKKVGGPDFGYRLVESLNLGTVVGLPIAIAAYFWANRLLPVDMVNRAQWEAHVMFLVWLACLLCPLLRPVQKGWGELMWIAAVAYAGLPLLNAVTTNRSLLHSIQQNDWIFAGVDFTFFSIALIFSIAAYKVQERTQISPATTNSSKTPNIATQQETA
uniref:PepSY-associated TM helix domain-containing protein n=1 Tax=Cellvibrio fontiphilus TaxID=1815559 RepID=UPI002B4C04A0|nr:PepSY-associated TM helix domain-containing protein [Cellvibrio fontiphilus]